MSSSAATSAASIAASAAAARRRNTPRPTVAAINALAAVFDATATTMARAATGVKSSCATRVIETEMASTSVRPKSAAVV